MQKDNLPVYVRYPLIVLVIVCKGLNSYAPRFFEIRRSNSFFVMRAEFSSDGSEGASLVIGKLVGPARELDAFE